MPYSSISEEGRAGKNVRANHFRVQKTKKNREFLRFPGKGGSKSSTETHFYSARRVKMTK
jgi:hypothetical protein